MIKSYCGMNCEKCLEYSYQCPGCNKISGKPLWASGQEDSQCPIFTCCAVNKQLSCCYECNEPICHVKNKLAENV